MARLLFGSVGAQGASGSMNKIAGGSTFQKNNIARVRVIPVQPNTQKQQLTRSRFSAIQALWLGLDLETQQEWNAAAASGDWQLPDPVTGVTRNPASGRALFIELNMNIATALGGLTGTIEAVPVREVGGDTAITGFTVASDGGTPEVAILYSGTLGTGETHVFEMSGPLSPGFSRFRANSVRGVVVSAAASGSAVNSAVGTAYQTAQPAVPVGSRVCYRVMAVNSLTGQTRQVGKGIVVVTEV
jgi:hypothetical protein